MVKARDQFLIGRTKTGKVGRYHLAFRNVTAIERARGGDWLIRNHTAEHRINLAKVANIAFFGLDKDVTIPVAFLHDLNREHIALVFSDLSSQKLQILEPHHNDGIDHVTGLHEVRRSEKKSSHVARELIRALFRNRKFDLPPELEAKLKGAQSIAVIRSVEAEVAKQYWRTFFEKRLDVYTVSRRDDHPICQALNATSAHLAQVVSRHLINHRLPLEHGVMHVCPMALVFDLMEPFRGFAEDAVESAYLETRVEDLVERSLAKLSEELESYHSVRQLTNKKSLQQLMEITVMNLVEYGNSQSHQDNSIRFWVPTIGRRKFSHKINENLQAPE